VTTHRLRAITLGLIAAGTTAGCDGGGSGAAPARQSTSAAAAGSAAAQHADQLSMQVDGVPWSADHDVFGAFHPAGYEQALIVAGSFGPKDANEQGFNLNLYRIGGPGRYTVRSGNAEGHVAQLANYSAERYLAGGPFGFDVQVDVIAASPERIEVRFAGTLTANDGTRLTLSDGHFVYRP
jgi:hypothetical protein